ncbi:hypothetical protein CC1G_00428 [Coprinopsis cinerea okayama7|uniref:Uncharacterized protein n=1 Tax=Coprinopsis cinerea (strain Okayama-7 / 130 / ATCC MYA-4618 / FGSC 9003) TaxID=240176 RepID=A8NXX0_COPC7|nr:hypothetical protein CC1G_00428 [Coprinopsis cinerea okayama7\|eukprot:XP_001837292.1 hypothetical protein CC1G_00428 [Coprinopsis cinerea okayama7\
MNGPSSPIRSKQPSNVPPGFRPSPRQRRPISEMTIRELQDLHKLNAKILADPGASTSTYVQRVSQEQRLIESRLLDVDGIEKLGTTLKKTKIKGEGDMEVDEADEPPVSRTLEAKRKALAQYGQHALKSGGTSTSAGSSFTLAEAIELEQQAHQQERERQQRILEKKRRQGVPIRGEVLTREEREARIWAFLTRKPTDSDLEDDDDDDSSDDDDPAAWFEDDQDDGVKGQDIVEPDFDDDLSHIIQVDHSRIGYDTFYPNRNAGD